MYPWELKQFIQDLFMRFYRDFDKVNDPNFDNIQILHSWGSLKTDGFYSSLCKTFNVEKKTISAEETVPEYSFKFMLPFLKNFLLSKLSAG